jgi:hypothetical protein
MVDRKATIWLLHSRHFEGGRLVEDLGGDQIGDGTALFELGGFYRETAAFLDAVEAGRAPSPGLRDSRQSVEVAEHVRAGLTSVGRGRRTRPRTARVLGYRRGWGASRSSCSNQLSTTRSSTGPSKVSRGRSAKKRPSAVAS